MRDTTADGTNAPPYEHSPSTGWRETAEIMHAIAGLGRCDVLGCDRDADPVRVMDTDDALRESVRCSIHAKDFLEVSS